MKQLLLIGLATLAGGASEPAPTYEVDISAVRNAEGVIHACLTATSRHFPDCKNDHRALKLKVPASSRRIRFVGFTPGEYALTLFHDQNGNGRLDTTLGIPREGFGFSRNPVVRFGAPRFGQVNIKLSPGYTRETVRMQYIL